MGALTARDFLRTALDLEVESADVFAEHAPNAEERLAWIEYANRLHVFRLFQYSDHATGCAIGATLQERLDQAGHLDPFERVWVTEGIGFGSPYAPADAIGLPQESLVPLHAGIGLAIATRGLRRRNDRSSAAIVEEVVAEGRRASVCGFERIAFEAFGLAVRTLAPHVIVWFDRALASRSAVERACFWHGVGRGSYFAVSNWHSVNVSATRVMAWAERRAPDASAVRNLAAGFIWAVALVNLRSPAVLEAYAAACAGTFEAEAIAHGVEAALIVWSHAAPDDDGPERLLAHAPGAWASALDWERLVRVPAFAGRRTAIAVAARGHLQDLFGLPL